MSAPRLLLVPDSFKGTFEAPQVAAAMARGVAAAGGEADPCPIGDGGEGTAAALIGGEGGRWVEAAAHDPLGRPLEARFALLGDGGTAVVEVAAASGLALLAPGERDPERADSRGTGELIAAALRAGARTVLVAAGGSATTDGGRGAIEALREAGGVPGGAVLEVLCDVRTPFEDAARVFAPQKGADPAAVARLSARLEELAAELPRDPRGVAMGGCAGGLSGGLMAAFGARLRPGAEYVLDRVGFDERLALAAAAICGEGRLDEQSLQGKAVGTLAARCARAGRPLHAIVGADALGPERAAAAGIASVREASTLAEIEAAAAALVSSSR
ncbi:MAG TPA: glycerate kinase [Solirubrobacterales bacterium]